MAAPHRIRRTRSHVLGMCGAPERRRIRPTSWIRRADVAAWPTSITGDNAAPILMAGAIAGRHRRGESSEHVRDLGAGPVQDRVRVTNAGQFGACYRCTTAADPR